MATTYTRPSDWLTMPTVASSAQTFVGLFAVNNHDSNYVALKATTSTGNYQVDWGDGNVTTHASNTNAEYLYTYSAISESTLSNKGYKQVLITVTPVTGNITGLNTNIAHSTQSISKKVTWLEYLINLPNLTSLSIAQSGSGPKSSWLEKITISHLGGLTTLSGIFSSMSGLKAVNITASTTGITNTSYMFASCVSLISVNLFNTSNVTNAVQMFYNCPSLEQVPNFNFSKVTQAISMFDTCTKLKTVPAFDMRLNTDFSGMFSNCGNLTEIPLIDTRSGTNFSNFAASCSKLKTVANLDMSKATVATNTFGGCALLDNFPPMIVGNANCNLTGFLGNNYTMKKVGDIDVSKAINFTSFFNNNQSLRTLPALNLNAGTTLTTMVSPVMASAPFTNVRASLSVANKNLGRLSIIEVFNGLASGVTSRTITISNNPGFSALPLNSGIGGYIRGATIVPSTNDVYVSSENSFIYKQTGGVGPFVVDNNVSSPWYRGMGVDIYNNVYCTMGNTTSILKKTGGAGSWTTVTTTGLPTNPTSIAGDFLGNLYVGNTTGLYKQTALTGAFVQVYSGAIDSFDISPFDGSIYIVSGGVIYKQTAGTGSFVSVQTLANSVVVCMPNGDVYASNGTLYKQTAGTGSFVSMGILTNTGTNMTRQIVDKADGTLFTASYGGDVFSLDFNKVVTPADRLIATSKGWTIA